MGLILSTIRRVLGIFISVPYVTEPQKIETKILNKISVVAQNINIYSKVPKDKFSNQ